LVPRSALVSWNDYVYYCCQYHVLLGSLVMGATSSVTAEVVHHTAALLMDDALMGYVATAGLNLRTVRLVCANSGLV